MTSRRRFAVVGLGGRAGLYTEALAGPYRDQAELVAFCDPNATRMAVHNRAVTALGHPEVPTFGPDRFADVLKAQRPDTVVVTSMDATHDGYIVAALEAGCDVITEKPMTIDAERARRILDAERASRGTVRVTFNYRYNPVHEEVKKALAAGSIGEIGSVHFEWLLDTRHGADYFRRWHRMKANSGGLMVHKSTHHFDLVNWWLDDRPELVFGSGSLFFYGRENGERRGLARDYVRAHGAPEAADDPFAIRLAENDELRELYLDAEGDDGYHRDQNVFAPGITIEDDMAVLVRYARGATMSYHLTAYSPWEGYRVAFNGSRGRLELIVHENRWARAETHGIHGTKAEQDARATLTLHPHWEPPQTLLDSPLGHGHGGGDARMLADLLTPDPTDPLGRSAGALDGAWSLVTGLAANRSFETGLPVTAKEILTP
ncbi:Gfo/Idh/MocA family protein [Pseudonocardia sp. TRM90224]|uniref:Gfo/Idh/MocA family protein n=1 Tax=Pseudonocardia sp. TRM90224 TaxID=2812678 RepID=UPI001E5E1834|nr:Gfo/Idh/MocA family oxidoreductase [Pseudonocardia sp. TRM90224]